MNNKYKMFMFVSLMILIGVVVIGAGTYAWYLWNTSENEKTQIITNVGAATIYYDGGSAITDAKLKPEADKSNGIVKNIQIKTNSSNSLRFNLYLDITSLDPSLQHESFRYALYRGNETTAVKEGNFSQEYLNGNIIDCMVNDGVKHIELLINEPVTTALTNYILYIWIDGVNYSNPSSMSNKNFIFNIHATGENAIILEGKIPDITQTIEGTFAYDLINLYNVSEKSDALNNSILYHLDDKNKLMSDIAGNLRFYGPSDSVNNYIYFNCSDYNNQSDSTCELWRIIGVFDGKLKIIRNSSIGNLAWDQDKNQDSSKTTYSNDWVTSSLQEFLNGLYYDRGSLESLVYYSGSNGASTTQIDLEKIGITESTRSNNLISKSVWYLGAYNTRDVYSNEIYTYERTNKVGTTIQSGKPFTIVANVGLMYASDYGYGTDFSKCSNKISAYNSSMNSYACRTNNWLYNGNHQWLINPTPLGWDVNSSGYVNYDYVYIYGVGVRPTVYLNPELRVDSVGDGTSDNPYRIDID